jgi:hypothetical protein
MPEINLGPTRPAERVPAEPSAPALPAGALLRRLPARWRRPVPRSMVAVGSAALAAVAMALYLDRPAAAPAPEPAPLLSPESWLDLQDGGFPVPFELTDGRLPRWAEAGRQHPPDAILVPLADRPPALLALPPGSYQVRASCSLAADQELIDAFRIFVNFRRPAEQSGRPFPDIRCDGAARVVYQRLPVTRYQAFFADYHVLFGDTDRQDPLSLADPLIVLSFTPTG